MIASPPLLLELKPGVCPPALTAAAVPITSKTTNVYTQRQLTLHLASRCLCSSWICVCVRVRVLLDQNKLLARCCWFSVAAGWVAAEGKQAEMPLLACHSGRERVCVCVGGG